MNRMVPLLVLQWSRILYKLGLCQDVKSAMYPTLLVTICGMWVPPEDVFGYVYSSHVIHTLYDQFTIPIVT